MSGQLYQQWSRILNRRAMQPAIMEAGSPPVTFDDIAHRAAAFVSALGNPAPLRHRAVLFQFANGSDWLALFLACQQLGAIAVPLDPDLPQSAIEQLIQQLRPAAICNQSGCRFFSASRRYAPASMVKLTSGSTGTPKPLFFADHELLADGNQIRQTMYLRPEDRHLAAIPFGHSYGFGNLVLPLLTQGATLCLCHDPLPHAIASCCQSLQATVFPAVPAILRGLSNAAIPPDMLQSLRMVISAGSPITPDQAQQFHARFNKRIHNFYGSSETGGIAFDPSGDLTLTGTAIGKPMAKVAITRHANGRICVSSPAVFRRHNPRRNGSVASCLMPDRGYIDAHGNLVLTGRTRKLLKLAGKRLNPTEIESALRAIQGVTDAFVTTIGPTEEESRMAAAVESNLPASTIRDALLPLLPAWKIPRLWRVIPTFPRTDRGKLKRTQLLNDLRTNARRILPMPTTK